MILETQNERKLFYLSIYVFIRFFAATDVKSETINKKRWMKNSFKFRSLKLISTLFSKKINLKRSQKNNLIDWNGMVLEYRIVDMQAKIWIYSCISFFNLIFVANFVKKRVISMEGSFMESVLTKGQRMITFLELMIYNFLWFSLFFV